jgi:WD40 repeat protein
MKARLTRLLTLMLVAWVCGTAPLSAQYFGRNKVQFKHLDFQVIQTEHFELYFYPEERAGADISARLAERWYARLSRIFAHTLKGRQPLVLYASQSQFSQTNIIQDELSEGTGGVTEPLRRRIVLPLAGSIADTDHVIGHELVHAFQFDMTTKAGSAAGQSGMNSLPLWFIEGMAEYVSIGPVAPNTAMWLRDAVSLGSLPTVSTLDDSKYFPYRWGHAFWAYVGGLWGDHVIRELLLVAASNGVDAAIQKVLGISGKDLSHNWQAAIRIYESRLTPPGLRQEPTPPLIAGKDFTSELNVGPALSPNGRLIAFLSSRSWFSIDLYVADAATGRIVRKLTSTASDPHIASLQFIYSSGTWDPTSRRLAVATVAGGRPTITIFDVQSGRTEREVPLSTVDEVLNPTWSPDGHAIAFTGLSQGLTDLFLCDLTTSAVRRLTNDAYADLHPAWSPDGRTIAFVTDRFSTDLPMLATAPYRLALLDVQTGAVTPLPDFADASSVNPQWSPDGRSLYFISSPDGIPNVFRLTVSNGDIVQLTSVATGVSGITVSSPALSVAAEAGTIGFSVYEHNVYNIYTSVPDGLAPPRGIPGATAAVLPPIDRMPSEIATLLADARFGLPEPISATTTTYSPRLTLEGIGQPFVAVGASQFGAALGGGLSMYFSDLLGNHVITTAFQFSSLNGGFSAKDVAAQVGYFNRSHRWNWGIVTGQTPYLSGGFESSIGVTTGGEPVWIDRSIIDRQTERSVAGVVAYPLNRAQRIEASGGVTHISFERQVDTTASSLYTGRLVVDTRATMPLAPSIGLGTSSVAFVSDTANFGGTSPVQGERYRLEAAPTFGQIKFTSLLADYRRYFMPVSFYTLAVRAIHIGRYGNGGEDSRLSPLFLGYPTLVRGYDLNSFSAGDCVSNATSSCPAFDRLLGSRLMVGNVEFRFPLLRPFEVSRRMYGPVPIELALFADGGVAWNSGEGPSILGGGREGISSTGVSVRLNLGGYAVGQFDVVRPLQRPGKGWIVQFNLTPGF